MAERPGRIADERGEVADQEDDRVPHVLKVLELAHQNGVAEMQVRRGRIEAGLHPNGLAPRQAIFPGAREGRSRG